MYVVTVMIASFFRLPSLSSPPSGVSSTAVTLTTFWVILIEVVVDSEWIGIGPGCWLQQWNPVERSLGLNVKHKLFLQTESCCQWNLLKLFQHQYYV